jgi:ABC-type nitrate/sulfonate/bicarbonate transport system substrate-binding protein
MKNLIGSAVLAIAAIASPAALAQDKIIMMSAGPAISFSPIYLLELLGYAKDEGLDYSVKTVFANTLNLVVAGEGDLAVIGLSSALVPAREGKETSIVYSLATGLATGFVAGTQKIKSIKDCTRVSTSMAGSAVYSATIAYKNMTNAPYSVLQLGDPAQIVPSVLSGGSDCAVSALGILQSGLDNGMHLIVDPRVPSTIPPGTVQDTIGTGFWGMKDSLQKKRPAVEKLLRAMKRVHQYIRTTPTSEVAALLVKHEQYKAFKPDVALRQLEQEKLFWFPNDGYFPSSYWAPTLKYYQYGMPFIEPGNKLYAWESRVDMSYWIAANGQPARK